jgi:hypothetical protein
MGTMFSASSLHCISCERWWRISLPEYAAIEGFVLHQQATP